MAIHKGRYFRRVDGLALGPGPFVAALEYASGQEAVCLGKPEPAFFESVLADIGSQAGKTIMIGDVSSCFATRQEVGSQPWRATNFSPWL